MFLALGLFCLGYKSIRPCIHRFFHAGIYGLRAHKEQTMGLAQTQNTQYLGRPQRILSCYPINCEQLYLSACLINIYVYSQIWKFENWMEKSRGSVWATFRWLNNKRKFFPGLNFFKSVSGRICKISIKFGSLEFKNNQTYLHIKRIKCRKCRENLCWRHLFVFLRVAQKYSLLNTRFCFI